MAKEKQVKSFFFSLIIPFFTAHMISHLPSFPSSLPLMRVLPHPPTYSHLTALASPYPGASNLYRTKGLPSH